VHNVHLSPRQQVGTGIMQRAAQPPLLTQLAEAVALAAMHSLGRRWLSQSAALSSQNGDAARSCEGSVLFNIS
jgi:hypothetical protein